MPSAICEITKFPVGTEFARRGVRKCACAACEAHARGLASETSLETDTEISGPAPQD
jgi:hypothetical protein